MVRTVGLACAAMLLWTAAQAQECSQLLTHGIYDVRSSASDLSTASSYSSWFCDQRFSSSQQADEFGGSLGFPFKGIPVKLGFNSSSESWSEWYSNFCSSVQQNQSLQSRVRDLVQTINPQIVQAFNACIANDGLHVWLERTYDPRTFKFAARFNSPNQNNPVAKIKTFDPGPNVTCNERPTTVDRAEWRTRCTRKNDSPVAFVVTADWLPHGGGDLTLPAVAKYDLPETAKREPQKFLDISGVIVTAKGKTTISQDGYKVWYSGFDDCCSYTFDGTFSSPQTVEGYQKRIASNFGGGPCRIDSKITIKINSTRNITVYENFIPGSHPPNNTCGVIDFNPKPVSYTY